jgi:NAD(P)-dependent dehydrogenase (short-subunit alcohol dehydrogenase family)
MTAPSGFDRILITGASSGIGAACAQELAQRGKSLILTSLSSEKLDKTLDNCSPTGAAIWSQPADLTSPAAVQSLFAGALQRFGGVDAVIHCAGAGLIRSPERWIAAARFSGKLAVKG